MGKISDEKIIAALVSTPTIRQAAKLCNCSEALIYGRLRKTEFKARYDAERRAALERSSALLQAMYGNAVATMGNIIADKTIAPQTRLNAADAIIRNGIKLAEQVDVIRRVDELEAIVKGLEARKR